MVLLFAIRVLLAFENKRRDAEPPDSTYEEVYVVRINDDGTREEVKVSKVFVHCLLASTITNLRGLMN
jgi:MFS transporter, ACS family, allantoate permease